MDGLTCDIRGHGGHCTIDVLRYENDAAQNVNDANWLSCHVAVAGPRCRIETAAAFTTHEIKDFTESLRRAVQTLDGTAAFETMEQALTLRIQVSKSGTAKVAGVLRVDEVWTVNVSFAFESDQSFLQDTVRQLDAIGRVFPPKGRW